MVRHPEVHAFLREDPQTLEIHSVFFFGGVGWFRCPQHADIATYEGSRLLGSVAVFEVRDDALAVHPPGQQLQRPPLPVPINKPYAMPQDGFTGFRVGVDLHPPAHTEHTGYLTDDHHPLGPRGHATHPRWRIAPLLGLGLALDQLIDAIGG